MIEPIHDDGGPAFPTTTSHGFNSGMPGMTLRDYFAAKAMQGQIAGIEGMDNTDKCIGEVAAIAYAMADAMVAARSA